MPWVLAHSAPAAPWMSSVAMTPSVAPVTRRVVEIGLARLGDPLDGLGQTGIRVGRADHDQAGLVEDRDRQLGRTGVVGPDVDHRVGVGRRLVGVLLLDRSVPVAVVRGGRVVEVRVLDGEVADLLAVEDRLDLLDERVGLLGVGALAGKARVDVDLARAACPSCSCRLQAGSPAAALPPADGAVDAPPDPHAATTNTAPATIAPSLVTFMYSSSCRSVRRDRSDVLGRFPCTAIQGSTTRSSPRPMAPVRSRPPIPLPGDGGWRSRWGLGALQRWRDGRTSGGAQVAAEAMPYISHRRVDCNIRSTSARGRLSERFAVRPRRRARDHPGDPDPSVRNDRATLARSHPSAWTTRSERLGSRTSIDSSRCVPGRARWPPATARSSRPTCSASWSTCRRPASSSPSSDARSSAWRILALRPSVRAGGFVGTVDLLVVDPRHDVDAVADALIEEILRSARNKGCASVEVARPTDAAERARWDRRGFVESDRLLERPVAARPDRRAGDDMTSSPRPASRAAARRSVDHQLKESMWART